MIRRNILTLMAAFATLLVSITTKVRAVFAVPEKQKEPFSWVWLRGRFVRFDFSKQIKLGMLFIHVRGELVAKSMYRCVERDGETVSVSQSLDNFRIDLVRLDFVSKIEDGQIVAYLNQHDTDLIDHFESYTWPAEAGITADSVFALAV